jgi:type I restriction enzyme M protein
VHYTLKKKPLRYEDMADFIACYNPANRQKRADTWHPDTNPDGRWRKYSYEKLIARDKTSLDIFWLKDKSLTALDNLPEPDELAEEIIENLEAGTDHFSRENRILESFRKTVLGTPQTACSGLSCVFGSVFFLQHR